MTVATAPLTKVAVGDSYVNLSASTLIKTGDGFVYGIFVASGSSPTMKLWDNTSAAGNILVNTTALNIGWNPCPFRFTTGLYFTVGGTVDCTVCFT